MSELTKPFFSVIVPTFNRAKLIEATLNSVLSQTYKNFELIIVDDCSEDIDELKSKVNQYNDDRIKLIQHDKNRNGAAARNTGINAAKGKYIAFLDSDDTWPLERLAIVYDVISLSNSSENCIYYGQVDLKFPQQVHGETRPQKGINNSSVSEYLFLQNGLIQTSTIICLTTVAQKIMFDERFIRHQDYDFCLRAEFLHCKFIFIPAVLSNWLKHKGANVVAKGANADFCQFWLGEMSQYFTTQAKYAYQTKVLMPIAFESGRWKLGFSLLVNSLNNVPFKIYVKAAYASIKGIVKHFLSVMK